MDRRNAIIAAIGAVVVIGAILVVALSGDDDADVVVEDESPTAGATETETEVVVSPDETMTATPAGNATGPPSPTASALGTVQTYIVGPQEPITTQTSEEGTAGGEGVSQFAVVGRYDGEDLPDTVELATVPCDNADPTLQPVAFADRDGDGEADGLGDSDTGAALLQFVNGEQVEGTVEWPVTVDVVDGQLTFAFESFEPDCLVPVVFTDENDNLQLDLDPDGVPTEPFGVGRVEWTS